eukprot:CAMPEP_0169071120 /NCGR_PEP_ID=MMETSP1015-20121227/5489_1 /TAXON_ID=342587 /ORGANISM="Karlodinium micrum, Strain CCMP2283" /LENGTH=768 /DNA_ID=CAMNT_0009130183 /DNA_START=86 /DNA_END=2392 /DNA_ORIENTATION=+
MMAACAILSILGFCSASASSLGAAGEARLQSLEQQWSQELQPVSPETKVVEYKSPIKRVVSLLEKMRAELIAEADKEAEMYDKMVCWCETNEKEKTKAIADAEALQKELTAEIESRAAKFGEESTEIERLKEQIAEDTAALKQATAIREKEAAKFYDMNKDLIQFITNVKNAIQILSKHQSAGASFVQLDESVLASMRVVLKDLAFKQQLLQAERSERPIFKHSGASFLATDTGSSTSDALLKLVDASSDATASVPLEFAEKLLAKAAHSDTKATLLQTNLMPTAGSYVPQSNQIFGILTTMKEEFEASLSEEEKNELKAKEDFEAMAKAKTEQIAVAKEKLDSFEAANADNQKALSDAKENLELVTEQRSQDVEFLRNLRVTCQDLDRQWEERSKTRSQETLAVSEALKIITADDNMDLLRQTVSLLQVDAQAGVQARRARAVTALRRAAQSPSFEADDLLAAWHSRKAGHAVGASAGPRMQLSTLAVSASLDSFTKVKEAMDKMTEELKKEQEEEVKFKAYCTKELNLNEKETYEKTEQKEDLEALIEKLTKLIKKLGEEIADAQAQIADTEVAIKKASQVREGENAEFQTVVADQRATQDILTKALLRLKDFYKKAKGGALVQTAQTPPVKFNAYKKNAGASPVLGMIEQIIEDSKALEAEAVAGETEAQAGYEKFVKDSNDLISKLSDSISAKTEASATAKEDMEQAKSDFDTTMGELQSLAMTEHDLHAECDWVLRNFALRQKARMDEMEAIQQAKAILSGEQ